MRPEELLAATEKLTEHMVAKGVRKAELQVGEARDQAGWSIVLELDPAAQIINAPRVDTQPEDTNAKIAAGLCTSAGCHEKGGHMRTAYCKQHFQIALSGRMS